MFLRLALLLYSSPKSFVRKTGYEKRTPTGCASHNSFGIATYAIGLCAIGLKVALSIRIIYGGASIFKCVTFDYTFKEIPSINNVSWSILCLDDRKAYALLALARDETYNSRTL